jgi:hypothetical protein
MDEQDSAPDSGKPSVQEDAKPQDETDRDGYDGIPRDSEHDATSVTAQDRYGSRVEAQPGPDGPGEGPPTSGPGVPESDWTLGELGAMVSERLGGLARERQSLGQQIARARSNGKTCGLCGKAFGAGAVMWRGETTVSRDPGAYPFLVPMCDQCRSRDPALAWDAEWTDPEPCESCGRPVRNRKPLSPRRRYVTCSEACRLRVQRSRESERRALARLKVCATCHEPFEASRSDAKYCSAPCRQKAYRRRRRKEPDPLSRREEDPGQADHPQPQ